MPVHLKQLSLAAAAHIHQRLPIVRRSFSPGPPKRTQVARVSAGLAGLA